jgi:serine/threonine-protein kinase HipA
MATTKSPRIKVLYVGTEQGYAGALVKESQHIFTYAPEILDPTQPELAISLTMPLRAAPWVRMPMLPVFQTFLPEGFLKERIIDRMSKTMKIDDMALLAFSGENAIGRLRLSASKEAGPAPTARETLSEILSHEGTQDLFEYLCDKYLISSGIAGVQPKVMVPIDAEEAPAAAAQAAGGKLSVSERASLRARQLIVKVAGDDFPHLPVNEFHCMSIAKACGPGLIEVPNFWLSEDKRRLAIERFDLDLNTGHYLGFEDMVSLQGKVNEDKYEGSYENIAKAVRINCSEAHISDSLRRLFALVALSVVLRNGDAHLKNFGLLYTDPTTDDVRLAPAYDLVTTTAYIPADTLALKLGGTKAWPGRAALEAFGTESCGVKHPGAVIDQLLDVAMQYRAAEDDPIWPAQRAAIESAAAVLMAPRIFKTPAGPT